MDRNNLRDALVVVSCSKRKLKRRAEARDLYISPLFRLMRRYAEHGKAWRILSAKHGLLDPDTAIDPYDMTLEGMNARARRQWACGVLKKLLPLARCYGRVFILAGSRYREGLVDVLRREGICVCMPMEGLRIGEQLRWLSCELARLENDQCA